MNDHKKKHSFHSILFLAVFLLAPVCGVAQGFSLEEIVVTSQRREQNIQDVGIAVTAYSGEQMSKLGFVNAVDVTAQAPGVQFAQPNGPSSFTFAIRGVTQNDFADSQESPSAAYMDDVYISQMAGLAFQMFDMERVELLRGPQGTLFGRNATGGLAHFITKRPTEELEGYASVSIGQYDQLKLEGATSGALSDTISGRISFASHHHDGFYNNLFREQEDVNNANQTAFRGQLLFDLSPDSELLVSARFSDVDERAQAWATKPSDPATGRITGGFINGPYTINVNAPGRSLLETEGVTAKLNWTIGGDIDAVAIVDYNTVFKDFLEDSDTTPNDFFHFFQTSDVAQTSAEFRISGDSDSLTWVAGAYALNIDGDYSLGNAVGGAHLSPFTSDTRSYALFGQVEYVLGEDLKLTLGARNTWEEKDYVFNEFDAAFPGTLDDVDPVGVLTLFGGAGQPFVGRLDDSFWTGKIGLDWNVSDDLLLYASINRGVKGGGFNAPLFAASTFTADDFEFDKETLDSIEIGSKLTLASGKGRVNFSAFVYDYQDYQALQFIGLSQKLFNADTEAYGAELELVLQPTDGLTVSMGAAYLDIEVQDADLGFGAGPQNLRPANAPEWNFNGLMRYEWLLSNGSLALQGDVLYVSEQFYNLTNLDTVHQEAYTVGNIRASYSTDDGKFDYSLFVNNVWDELYSVQNFDVSGFFGVTQFFNAKPRWVGASVVYHW